MERCLTSLNTIQELFPKNCLKFDRFSQNIHGVINNINKLRRWSNKLLLIILIWRSRKRICLTRLNGDVREQAVRAFVGVSLLHINHISFLIYWKSSFSIDMCQCLTSFFCVKIVNKLSTSPKFFLKKNPKNGVFREIDCELICVSSTKYWGKLWICVTFANVHRFSKRVTGAYFVQLVI